MTLDEPQFTLGIEEEYLLVDQETRSLVVDPPKSLLSECKELLGNQVTNELLRSQIEIISKCGIIPGSGKTVDHYDSSGDSIIASVEQSLSNLKTDYLDTLLLHRPDYLMNQDEVAEAFTKLSDEGKVKHFGVSNFSESQFTLLQARLPYSLITNQTEFMIHSDKILTIFDPTPEIIQEYKELIA